VRIVCQKKHGKKEHAEKKKKDPASKRNRKIKNEQKWVEEMARGFHERVMREVGSGGLM